MDGSEARPTAPAGFVRRVTREKVMSDRVVETAETPSLDTQVADVAKPWNDSAYYAEAEAFIHAFWNTSTPFRKMFDQLDLTSVVELACGHGRHGAQMVARAGRLVMLDIIEENLDRCRERLKPAGNVEFLKGNGKDFQPIPSGSATGIYCYDAMVHFSPDIVEAYLTDTARILKPGGKALFHHSNYGAAPERHWLDNPHCRNHMTVRLFLELVEKAGLKLVETRVFDWGSFPDLDAVTLLRKP